MAGEVEHSLLTAGPSIKAQAVLAGCMDKDELCELGRLLPELKAEPVPMSVKQADLARAAYLRYGKRQGHRAQLDYGDMMAYALAKNRDEPLAFVGNDFHHTNLEVVRLPLGT